MLRDSVRALVSWAIIAVFSCAVAVSAEAADKQLRAGAATSNITPPLGAPIVGGWKVPEALHIHDELHVRCLVLDDGQTKLAFAICDNVGIPREVYDNAKARLEKITGIPQANLLMAATHTHSGARARGGNKMVYNKELTEYQQFVADRIVDGVRRAVHQLEPAKIGWGSVDVPQHVFNRRWFMKPGTPLRNPFGGFDKVRMNPRRGDPNLDRPAGPTDPEVFFLSVQSESGRPLALLGNYSLHYVGGVRRGDISADYFAMFADRIQQLLKADRQDPPFVGILTNGTSGDVNNINFRVRPERRAPYEQMRRVANDVAAAVYDAHREITFHEWVPLGAAADELTLAVRKPTAEQLAYFKKILEKPEDAEPWHRHERTYADRVLKLHESPAEVRIVLQMFRIGEVSIAAIPFEVFTETGLELKEKSPFGKHFTIELANGSYGYLPTPRHFPLGGYETWMGTNNVEQEAAPKIVRTLLQLADKLQGTK